MPACSCAWKSSKHFVRLCPRLRFRTNTPRAKPRLSGIIPAFWAGSACSLTGSLIVLSPECGSIASCRNAKSGTVDPKLHFPQPERHQARVASTTGAYCVLSTSAQQKLNSAGGDCVLIRYNGLYVSVHQARTVFHSELELQRFQLRLIMEFFFLGNRHQDQVRSKLSEICKKLLTDIPNLRIGIIAHGDYWFLFPLFLFSLCLCLSLCILSEPSHFHSDACSGSYVLKRIDLSNNIDALLDFVSRCGSTGGGDMPECYELCLQEAKSFSWSDKTAKAVVQCPRSIQNPATIFSCSRRGGDHRRRGTS